MEKAALSYGYGLSVTPLQLATAYAALANGGRMRAPTFVSGGANPEASVIDPHRRAGALAMLETVTGSAGTSRQAAVPGYPRGRQVRHLAQGGGGGYQDKRYISLPALRRCRRRAWVWWSWSTIRAAASTTAA